MIDLFAGSAHDAYDQIMQKTYGGVAPSGGWDFPSACVLSKAHMQRADLHINSEFPEAPDEDDPIYSVSMDNYLAPLTYARESGPGHTRSPFRFPPGFESPFGYLGKAFRPFSELCCILLAYHQDITGLENWFKDEWGIPDHVDLRRGYPSLVSLGDAAWAGISRSLRPFCTMLKSSQAGLRTVQHGTHRSKFGEHKLVDWERVEEVAKCIALQLVSDDTKAKKSVPRMDFAIVGPELPDAPQPLDMVWDFQYDRKITKEGTLWKTLEAAFARSESFETDRFERYSKGKLEVEVVEDMTPAEVMVIVGKYRTAKVVDVDWRKDVGPDIFEVEQDMRRVPDKPKLEKGNLHDLLTTLVASRIKKSSYLFPRPAHLHKVIDAIESGKDLVASLKEGREILKRCLGDRFLGLIRKFGDIIEPGRGAKYLAEVAHLMGAKSGDFQIRQPDKLWDMLCRREKGILYMLDLFRRNIVKYEKSMENPTLYDLFDECIMTGQISVLLAGFISRHRVAWANRFIREARGRHLEGNKDPEVIVEQLKSAVMRGTTFRVTADRQLHADEDSTAFVLRRSVEAYCRKRKKYHEADPKAPVYMGEGLTAYALILDKFVLRTTGKKQKITIESVLPTLWDMLVAFAEDVLKVLAAVTEEVARMRNGSSFPENESPEEEDVYDTLVDSPGEITIPLPVAAVPTWTPYEDRTFGDMEGEDDVSDFDDEEVNLLDLDAELREDYPGVSLSERMAFVTEHGRLVTYGVYKVVIDTLRQRDRDKIEAGFKGHVVPTSEGPDLL